MARKKMLHTILLGGHEADVERVCLAWCANFADAEVCRSICLAHSDRSPGVYRRALLAAFSDGLDEPMAHIFAAGAVWYALKERAVNNG